MTETQDFHIKLPVELVQRIDYLKISQRTTRQELVERLLERGYAAVTHELRVQDHVCDENCDPGGAFDRLIAGLGKEERLIDALRAILDVHHGDGCLGCGAVFDDHHSEECPFGRARALLLEDES